jgi:hypothetical protein
VGLHNDRNSVHRGHNTGGARLVGEYIGRMFMGMNNHPQFVIKEKLNFGDRDKADKIK